MHSEKKNPPLSKDNGLIFVPQVLRAQWVWTRWLELLVQNMEDLCLDYCDLLFVDFLAASNLINIIISPHTRSINVCVEFMSTQCTFSFNTYWSLSCTTVRVLLLKCVFLTHYLWKEMRMIPWRDPFVLFIVHMFTGSLLHRDRNRFNL